MLKHADYVHWNQYPVSYTHLDVYKRQGDDVALIQRQLNRIARNYPAIPTIEETNGFFNVQTDAAVRKFQEIFNLTVDGLSLIHI